MPRKRRRKAAARSARQRPERKQDSRIVAARALVMDGEALPPDSWATVVSPVNLEDGRKLMWHPPQPVAFNLVEAKQHQRRGVKERRIIVSNLVARGDGGYQPENNRRAINCLRELAAAVLFAFTAIESLANHAIEMLPDDYELERGDESIPKAEMTRRLGIDEKLKRVVPMMDGGKNVAGTETWERYRRLKFLRDELLHIKQRGYDPDPKARSEYDRLIAGEADNCADDAHAIVNAAWPGFLPDHVQGDLAELG
jgi:hypothetical protein